MRMREMRGETAPRAKRRRNNDDGVPSTPFRQLGPPSFSSLLSLQFLEGPWSLS